MPRYSPRPRRLRQLTGRLGIALVGTTAAVAMTAGVAVRADGGRHWHDQKPRTVVTTDMEQDDLASLIRYLLYTNDVDTQGLVYTSGR
jgi:hypothetical protein